MADMVPVNTTFGTAAAHAIVDPIALDAYSARLLRDGETAAAVLAATLAVVIRDRAHLEERLARLERRESGR